MLLNRICEAIEGEGYAVQPVVIPAVALGADHERKRVWIVAQNTGRKHGTRESKLRQHEEPDRPRNAFEPERSAKRDRETPSADAYDAGTYRSHRNEVNGNGSAASVERKFAQRGPGRHGWSESWYDAATRLCRVDDGISDRVHRLKALGNSIVPQIALEIYKAIEAAEKENGSL